jgi:hypothetical protein
MPTPQPVAQLRQILASLLAGLPCGKSQSNSTVALWRYNFGVVAPWTESHKWGIVVRVPILPNHDRKGGSPFMLAEGLDRSTCVGIQRLVNAIDDTRGDVERCQIPILQV